MNTTKEINGFGHIGKPYDKLDHHYARKALIDIFGHIVINLSFDRTTRVSFNEDFDDLELNIWKRDRVNKRAYNITMRYWVNNDKDELIGAYLYDAPIPEDSNIPFKLHKTKDSDGNLIEIERELYWHEESDREAVWNVAQFLYKVMKETFGIELPLLIEER